MFISFMLKWLCKNKEAWLSLFRLKKSVIEFFLPELLSFSIFSTASLNSFSVKLSQKFIGILQCDTLFDKEESDSFSSSPNLEFPLQLAFERLNSRREGIFRELHSLSVSTSSLLWFIKVDGSKLIDSLSFSLLFCSVFDLSWELEASIEISRIVSLIMDFSSSSSSSFIVLLRTLVIQKSREFLFNPSWIRLLLLLCPVKIFVSMAAFTFSFFRVLLRLGLLLVMVCSLPSSFIILIGASLMLLLVLKIIKIFLILSQVSILSWVKFSWVTALDFLRTCLLLSPSRYSTKWPSFLLLHLPTFLERSLNSGLSMHWKSSKLMSSTKKSSASIFSVISWSFSQSISCCTVLNLLMFLTYRLSVA